MAKPRILQQLDGELSTDIVLNSDPDQSMEAVTKQYVDAIEDDAIEYMNNNLLSKNDDSGSNITLTNANITLKNDPTADMQAATKQYVDNNGGTFQAIYNETTYEEIVNAYNQGKTIILTGSTSYPSMIFDLETIPNGTNTLYFTSRNRHNQSYVSYSIYLYITKDTGWDQYAYLHTPDEVYEPLYLNNQINTNLSSSKRYYRPILTSTSAPESSDGNVGDIWIQYST